MKELEQLSKLLGQQIEVQKRLLDLENEKSGILLKGSHQELDRIMALELPCIMKCDAIEKKRRGLQGRIGLGGASLSEIANRYPHFNNGVFTSQLNELLDIVTKLKKINNTNQKVLKARLDVVDHVLQAAGATGFDVVTYEAVNRRTQKLR
jgi:hypothetical protein